MLINGLKFSCATCIKGHRASNCKHTDRPLFEIRKKGRPVSQCLLCRDLRKTKQLHIKCICNKNKKDTASKKSTEPCDCQSQQKNELPNPSSSSSSVKRLSPIIIPSQTRSSSSSTSSNSSSGSSPPSYCWALVRPEENHTCQIHSQQNMGYVFQKTNQERQRRLSKSLKGASSPSSTSTSTAYNSMPSSLMSSHPKSPPKKQPTNLSSVTTTPATSTLLDNYLASTHASSLPLSRSLSSSSPTLDHDMMKELDDDLCSLLDNMIYQQQQQQHQLLLQHQQQDDISSQLSSTPSPSLLPSSTNMTTNSLSSSSTSSVPIHSMGSISNSSSSSRSAYQSDLPGIYGQCQKLAQWHPQGPPQGQVGESVIITMTPLPKWNSPHQQNDLQTSPQQQQTTISTTKIVTCYCGSSCSCPGCLVHPTSSIFASQGLDPYAGYPVQHSVSSDED